MSDPDLPRPGEIDLETGAVGVEPEPAAAEPVAAAAEPAVEPVADPAAEPVAEPAKPAKPGMLEELIEHRTARRTLERERQQLAPVLSRLTPELQQAIAEGRVMVKPAATSSDARQEQLEATAKRLRLYKDDGTGTRVPDLEAASLVDTYVREVAKEAVAPYQQMTLNKEAQANIDIALKFAEEHGYDVDSIRETYANALQSPNGAAMIANPDVAKQLWFSAVGQAVSNGKLPKAPAPAPDPAKEKTPAAVVTEPTGRRGSAGLSLSPKLAKVYKDNGVDPTKTFTATKKDLDFTQGIELE